MGGRWKGATVKEFGNKGMAELVLGKGGGLRCFLDYNWHMLEFHITGKEANRGEKINKRNNTADVLNNPLKVL